MEKLRYLAPRLGYRYPAEIRSISCLSQGVAQNRRYAPGNVLRGFCEHFSQARGRNPAQETGTRGQMFDGGSFPRADMLRKLGQEVVGRSNHRLAPAGPSGSL